MPAVVVGSSVAFARALDTRIVADRVLVSGPGADAAARAAASGSGEGGGARVLGRSEWIRERGEGPLAVGLQRAVTASAAIAAALAALGVLVGVTTRAPERRRLVALARAIGMTSSVSRLILVAEVVPLVIAAAAGGIAAGVAGTVLLVPSLGLRYATGGSLEPLPELDPSALVAGLLVAALVVGAAAIVDRIVRGRDPVASIMRVGGP